MEEELPLPYDVPLLRKLTNLLLEQRNLGHVDPYRIKPDERDEEKDEPAQPWAGFIQDAAIDYQHSSSYHEPLDDTEIQQVRAELKSLQKLLEKTDSTQALLTCKLNELSDEAHGMLNLGAVTTEVSLDDLFDEMHRTTKFHGQFIKVAKSSLKHLNNPSGKPEDTAYREFVANLAGIYAEATGGTIGKGHKFNDPSYTTPFEEFLMACIKPVRPNTTIESLRKQIDKIKPRFKYPPIE